MMELEVGGAKTKVKLGATARYPANLAHAIRNPGKAEAKALPVVIQR
jgi:uncharacterized cupin superfamily protein